MRMLRFKCFLEESMSKSFESAIDMFGIDTKKVRTIRNFSMAEKKAKDLAKKTRQTVYIFQHTRKGDYKIVPEKERLSGLYREYEIVDTIKP
tara:strand:- start:530 stop:805 length:276 start_codon:yes stop_codon:yes gene_type:complete